MRTIYTNVIGLRIEGVNVLSYKELPESERKWIASNFIRLLGNTTMPEKVAANIMERFDDKPIRQAYFKIRERSYFLDFFFLKRMIAVEIDGSSHKARKATDRRRDADFRSIGIRTIRIKNKDVMSGKLFDRLFKGMYK